MTDKNVNEAPEPTGICCVKGCASEAQELWLPDHCALREAGVEPEWKHICLGHDLALNKYVTRLFFGNKYDDVLDAYTERKYDRAKLIAQAKALGMRVVEL
jgi:hypothetical protein